MLNKINIFEKKWRMKQDTKDEQQRSCRKIANASLKCRKTFMYYEIEKNCNFVQKCCLNCSIKLKRDDAKK